MVVDLDDIDVEPSPKTSQRQSRQGSRRSERASSRSEPTKDDVAAGRMMKRKDSEKRDQAQQQNEAKKAQDCLRKAMQAMSLAKKAARKRVNR